MKQVRRDQPPYKEIKTHFNSDEGLATSCGRLGV